MRWGLERAEEILYKQTSIRVAPPEYVVIQKLRFYREGQSEKHIRDIKSIIDISGDKLDYAQISSWVERLGLKSEWEIITGSP